MNRETSIHSSDTLVVVDRSRQRRRMIIIGGAIVLALVVLGIALMLGRSADEKKVAEASAASAGRDFFTTADAATS